MKAARWVLALTAALCLTSGAEAAMGTAGRLHGSTATYRMAHATTKRYAWLTPQSASALWVGVPEGLDVPCGGQEQRLFADARDGRFDGHRLLVAGLIASGVNDLLALEQYVEHFDRLGKRLRGSIATDADERSKAAATLRFLHAELLQGNYGREITTLTASLDRGDYNCVSSAVLFNCLARQLGLDVRGVQVPGHAFSVVRTADGREIEVQTTCAEWFERSDGSVRLPAGMTGAEGPRRILSDPQLVAMIYFNRGVTAIRNKQYEEAVACNFKALWLDPHFDKASHNLLATLDRWETEYCEEGRYDEAIRLLGYALRIAPDHETLHPKYVGLCRDYVTHLLEQQQYDKALGILDEATEVLPREPWIEQARRAALRGNGVDRDVSTASARLDGLNNTAPVHRERMKRSS